MAMKHMKRAKGKILEKDLWAMGGLPVGGGQRIFPQGWHK
jgi:hypothetical protein